MFTVKLYGKDRARITRADFLTIIDESEFLKGITLHHANAGDDEVYYVGTITAGTAYADQHRTYDRAIIENAAGKTTEILFAPLAPPEAPRAGADAREPRIAA
jgi:hypothetical protein